MLSSLQHPLHHPQLHTKRERNENLPKYAFTISSTLSIFKTSIVVLMVFIMVVLSWTLAWYINKERGTCWSEERGSCRSEERRKRWRNCRVWCRYSTRKFYSLSIRTYSTIVSLMVSNINCERNRQERLRGGGDGPRDGDGRRLGGGDGRDGGAVELEARRGRRRAQRRCVIPPAVPCPPLLVARAFRVLLVASSR